LSPYNSHNSRRGLELAVPYYWNIAPERDATFVADAMSKRGAQFKGELRYIDRKYYGHVNLEYLPNDKELDRSRGAVAIQHWQQITPALTGTLDINRVSDSRYFVDLSSQVRQVSAGNLQQMGQLSYGGSGPAGSSYYLSGMYQHWQTLQDPLAPITPPYAREPQINFGVVRNDIGGRFDLAVPGETVRFMHPTLLEGTRVQFNPTLAAPILAPGYFITPKIGAHIASYSLDLTRVTPGQPDRPSSTVPWASLDSGLIFDRTVRWFGEQRTQTFEPRMFYVYAPYHNQDNIPVFDTGLSDLNYAQIFTENRFAGGDRFGDANQLTLAATSRILSDSGTELVRATLGQRYYFEDERVGLTPTSTLRVRNQSDFLASLGGRLARSLTFDTGVQYDAHDNQFERLTASARYSPEVAKVVSASYRYNRDTQLRQVDLTGQWPIATGWYAVGRFNYSLIDSRVLDAIGGLEYNAGCWVFRAALQRLQAATNVTSSGIFFQLEFNGFGSLGSDEIVTMLKRNVPGYVVTNPTQAGLVPPSMQRPLPFQQVF
ncbi:MAG: LPS-assembly protein LptD, partial [Burkholderiales bacterium]